MLSVFLVFPFWTRTPTLSRVLSVEGEAPTFEAIAKGAYPVSRPLFFYVKKAHVDVIPGMKGYLAEFASEKAWGEQGYLADKGMIPMPQDERKKYDDAVASLKTMEMK